MNTKRNTSSTSPATRTAARQPVRAAGRPSIVSPTRPCACGGGCARCQREAASLALEFKRPADVLRSLSRPAEDFDEDGDEHANRAAPSECAACDKEQDTSGPQETGWLTGASANRAAGAPARPYEAGWFTGDWYVGQNTIMCDGSGSMTIHESTNYPHGVQACTRQHESQHRTDWYGRYGNDICKDRKKGDLPYFDPDGKEAYASFLKTSECAAWKIGRDCRAEKLAACGDDACKTDVQKKVNWAKKQVKKYCG